MKRTAMANPPLETIVHRKAQRGGTEVLLRGTFSDERMGTLRPIGRVVGTFTVRCTFKGDRIPYNEVNKKMARLMKDKPQLKDKKPLVSYDFNDITRDRQIVCYAYLPLSNSEFDRFFMG